MDIKHDSMLLAWCEDSYVIPVPPVCHSGWKPVDWIKFIQDHGKFLNLEHYARRVMQIYLTSIYWKTLKYKKII